MNTDLNVASERRIQIYDLMRELGLICADSFSSEVQYTYERDDGHVRSWPDHYLISEDLLKFSSVYTIQMGSNLSPLFAYVDLQFRSTLKPEILAGT